jgi:hypothetical protein
MNIRPKVLGESVELEFQPRHKTLFHIGISHSLIIYIYIYTIKNIFTDDVGLLFYIVLTGSVHTLIRDSNIKDE